MKDFKDHNKTGAEIRLEKLNLGTLVEEHNLQVLSV